MAAGFPNPFGDTLCVPHYLTCFYLAFWRIVVWYYLPTPSFARVDNATICEQEDALKSAAEQRQTFEQWRHIKRQSSSIMMKQLAIFDTESDALELELPQLEIIEDSTPEPERYFEEVAEILKSIGDLNDALVSEVFAFFPIGLNEDQTVVTLLDESFQSQHIDALVTLTSTMTASSTALLLRRCYAALTTTVFVLNIAAIFAQWALWCASGRRDDASPWRQYQALVIALLYLPGIPLTVGRLSSDVVVLGATLWRITATFFLFLAPFWTHYAPSVFLFVIIPAMTAGIVMVAFYTVRSRFDAIGARIAVWFMVELSVAMCTVAMVFYYGGHGKKHTFEASYIHALAANYCMHPSASGSRQSSHWIVFDIAHFSWTEWSVILAWVFNWTEGTLLPADHSPEEEEDNVGLSVRIIEALKLRSPKFLKEMDFDAM